MKVLGTILTALLVAMPAPAQIGDDLGGGLSTEPQFKVSAVLDRTAITGGQSFRVGIVLAPAPHHKIYRSSVKVTLVRPSDFRVLKTDLPPGEALPDEPNVPAGEDVFRKRAVVVVHLLAPAGRVATGEKAALAFKVDYQGCSDKVCFPPESQDVRIDAAFTDAADQSRPANAEYFAGPDDLAELARRAAQSHDFSREVAARGHLVALLVAFWSGFLVSLTPCVWPLIPIILAIVGAGAEGKGWRRGLGLSLAYVAGMAVTYAVFGAVAGALGKSVQSLTQSPWAVGVVCLAFVALALSMFGLYEIRIPSALAGKLQQRRGTGIAGVFVMGLVSGLVASPCVSAPLLGLFAGVATLGSIWVGALAGFVFALGMGIILVVAGTSSKALAALPRSGEWMVSVKHFFGWVMLGVAVYFSEMIFGAAAYRGLMIALLAAAAGYLARSAGVPAHRLARVLGIVLLLLGVLYFVAQRPPEGGIAWAESVDESLARAKAEGKPAIVDVWASWCTYCHEMDREVFADKAVVDESRRFVMVKLDATVQTEAVARMYRLYGIVAPPAFVFVRSDGTHETVNGKLDREAFLKLMRATH